MERSAAIRLRLMVTVQIQEVIGGSAWGEETGTKTSTVTKNSVTVNGGIIKSIYGADLSGYVAVYGDATENTVYINAGQITGTVYGASIYGGKANENEVHISGGTVNSTAWAGAVVGGMNVGGSPEQTENDNKVFINGTATVTGDITGGKDGYYTATASGNTVTIDGSAVVTGNVMGAFGSSRDKTVNKVYINKGSVTGNVYGGRLDDSDNIFTSDDPNDVFYDVGNVNSNEVHIIDGTVTGNVYGGSLESNVTGDVKGNKVEITGGTIRGVKSTIYDSKVYGGYSEKGTAGGDTAADGNNVTITGGTVYGEVWGGYAKEGNAKNNTATMSGGNVQGIVTGGWAYGDATDNTLTVTGGTLRHPVGGYSDYGNANNNTVNFGGTAVSSNYMHGGQTYVGSANDNTVNITGGTIKAAVYGGYSDSGGVATGNTVDISGGTMTDPVIGGFADQGNANDNKVSVSGTATVGNGNYAFIYGGKSEAVNAATGNTVTLSGGTVSGAKGTQIYGGWTRSSSGATTGNTVNLTGSTTGLENAEVYGGNLSAYTGNELHVGGTKDGSVTGAWTGSSNNTVKKVSNFETIVYHSVNWSTTVAALEATTVENVGAIDIKNLKFDPASSTGTMALLKSGSDLSAITLNYSGGTGVTITTDGVVISGGSGEQTEETGVNGVKLTTQVTGEKVSLATDKKAINYSKGASTVSGITFGEFDTATAARDLTGSSFATANTVDATGLTFADTTKALKKNDSITLLNNATGITTTVANGTGKTIGINYTDDQKIAFAATATGNVTSAGGAVKYTVGSVAVSDIDVSQWNGTASAVTASWATKDATVKTAGISVTGLNPGDTKTILTAASGSDFSNVKLDASAWNDGGTITDTAVNGVGITGETTGGGVKVSDDKSQLVYQQDKKNVTGITLGAFDAAKAARSFGSGDDLTGATINADGFSISNLDAAKESIVVVDATNAVKDASGATLKAFTKQDVGDPVAFADQIDGTVLTFSGTHQDTLEQNDAKTQILYKVGDKNVSGVKFDGSVTWNDSEAYYTNDAAKYKFSGATDVDATNLKVTGNATTALKKGDSMTLLSATGMTVGTVTDQSDANKEASKVAVNYTDDKGVAFAANATGEVKAESGAVKYNINEVKMTDVDLSAWNGTAFSVPDTWTADEGSVKVATGSFTAPEVAAGQVQNIITADGAFFDDANISGANKYDADKGVAFSETQNNVTVAGTQAIGVAAVDEGRSLVYKADIKKADTVDIGAVTWQKGATLFDGSSATEYDYANVTAIDTDKFEVSYAAPETVAANSSMTLLKANDTLTAMVAEEKASIENAYEVTPVDGVTVNATLTSNITNESGNVKVTAESNQATALTFGKVEWKTDGALLDHGKTLTNVSFDGATVDTSGIDFYKEMYIDADQTMTLVSSFDGTPGEITGDKYLVGTAYEGEGAAEMDDGNLIFRTKTEAGVSEQTHKTLMAVEANMALLAAGNEYVGKVMDGLSEIGNRGKDGISTAAAIGGGASRYETGSYVSSHTWNAAVGIGAKREVKNGAFEYGLFGEYGKGSYTLHSDVGNGKGDAHYAGGGLLAKWTNSHDVYTEASFRLGRMSDSASNLLYGPGGVGYGYDVHANYYGAHAGVGKVFKYDGGKSLDVYGKYFYTKRDGVEFDAVQHYKLDSVASSVLRIGARYGTTDKKWNWYGGLAYEYEFDGEANGTVSGTTAIRAASIQGSSVRGEFGMRMDATKENPWQTDISLYGYGGKHRGVGGNVSVAYTF